MIEGAARHRQIQASGSSVRIGSVAITLIRLANLKLLIGEKPDRMASRTVLRFHFIAALLTRHGVTVISIAVTGYVLKLNV